MTLLEVHPATPLESIGWRLPMPVAAPATASPLGRLRAVLLLAGSVRQTPFVCSIGRSVLDLPWNPKQSVLDVWCDHVALLAQALGWERPLLQVLIDQKCAAPFAQPRRNSTPHVDVVVRRDRNELRGTGGLLRDVAEAYADDDYLLVAHAAQVLREPLVHSAIAISVKGGDIGLIEHRDGSPISLALVRCGSLRCLPSIGFVDLMEQGLPVIAQTDTIKVSYRGESTGLQLSTDRDYIRALLWHNRSRLLGPAAFDPLAEHWEPLFCLAERGAAIHPHAEVYDSVLLAGARVDAGATVVRSVVCPGAVVKRGQCIVDQLVAGHHGPNPSLANFMSSPATKRPGPAWSNTADEDEDEQSWAMPTT